MDAGMGGNEGVVWDGGAMEEVGVVDGKASSLRLLVRGYCGNVWCMECEYLGLETTFTMLTLLAAK